MPTAKEHVSGLGQICDGEDRPIAQAYYNLQISQGAPEECKMMGELHVTKGARNLLGIAPLVLKLGPAREARFALVDGNPKYGYYTIQLADALALLQ